MDFKNVQDILETVKGKSKNVTSFIESIPCSDGSMCFVLERRHGPELLKLLSNLQKQYTEKDASNILKDVVSALAVLHSNGIAHLDVTTENILCKSAKLEDGVALEGISLAQKLGDKKGTSIIGGTIQFQGLHSFFPFNFFLIFSLSSRSCI